MNPPSKARLIGAMLWLIVSAVWLQACVSSNPIAQAETLEQRAFATYGTYVIAKEQAAALVSGGQLSNSAVIAIGRARDQANPVVNSLLSSILEFQQIKAEYEAGGTNTETRYIAATNQLNAWITRAAPLIVNLVSAVQGAKP